MLARQSSKRKIQLAFLLLLAAAFFVKACSSQVIAGSLTDSSTPASARIAPAVVPSPTLAATAPAPSAPTTVVSIFPTLPGSFRTQAGNAAVDWNIATQWVVRTANATNIGARIFALTSLGIWRALQANKAQQSPADPIAVVACAGHMLLINQFPVYFPLYDQLLSQQTSSISEEELAKANQIASAAVVELLASKLDDGFQDPQRSLPTTAGPGEFQNVGSGNFRGVQQYASTQPLLLPKELSTVDFVANCTPPAPYPSDTYNAQLTATYLIGRNVSTVRTQDQTSTAVFWSDGGTGTTGIAGHWNQLVLATMPANITLEESAGLLARMNVAMYDTTITIFYLKYVFNRWRPITAIRVGDDLHPPEPNWTPLLLTPNNPSYPSVQGGYAGVAEILLADFYGTDSRVFSVGTEVTSPLAVLQSRTYNSFSFIASEVTQSRYFGGIEGPGDARQGREIGQDVALWVLDNFDRAFNYK